MTARAPFFECRPKIVAAGPLERFVALPPQTLLHAGPPFQSADDIPALVVGAAATAAAYEGMAAAPDDARSRISGGSLLLAPAQDHGVVVPLAFIAGPTTPAMLIACEATGARAVAPINDGPPAGALRFGAPDDGTVARLRFLAETVAPAIDDMVSEKPFDPLPIAVQAIGRDEDLHALVSVASHLFATQTASHFPENAAAYVQTSQQFFLNVWMGVCACFLQAAGEGVLQAAGANGRQVGVKRDAAGWITRSAPPPAGPLMSEAMRDCIISPAIGDSAVIEAAGFGAVSGRATDFRASLAPHVGHSADGASLTASEHPAFAPLGMTLCVRADRVGPDAPLPAHFAMLDAKGKAGLLGRGGFLFWQDAFD